MPASTAPQAFGGLGAHNAGHELAHPPASAQPLGDRLVAATLAREEIHHEADGLAHGVRVPGAGGHDGLDRAVSHRSSTTSTEQITAAARELGFAAVGLCGVEPWRRGAAALASWLAAGYQGEMAYMAGRTPRSDPKALLDAARTLIVVALPYGRAAEPPPAATDTDSTPSAELPHAVSHAAAADAVAPPPTATAAKAQDTAAPLTGRVARYAQGADYHGVLKHKLAQLAERCSQIIGREVLARACVDSAPLLEHEAAAQAGVGFIAKNTLTIVPGWGSYVVLGELLVDVELPVAEQPTRSKCGSCRACLDACPTSAFVSPYVLDARRCVSYLTIELRGPIPRGLRAAVGTMVFGCDICQEVCPFNASPKDRPAAAELAPRPHLQIADLVDWLTAGSAAYRRLVRGTALRRITRHQLARNAAVALGNSGERRAVEPLCRTLREHNSAMVRGHCAWALGRLGGERARAALQRALQDDPSADVQQEAAAALAQLAPSPDPARQSSCTTTGA